MVPSVTLTYYDKILVAIAVSLGGGTLTGVVTGFGRQTGIFAGALVATLFLYDAIYRNPPLPESAPGWKPIALVWHVALGGLLLTLSL